MVTPLLEAVFQVYIACDGRHGLLCRVLRHRRLKLTKGRISVNQMLTIIANGSSEFFVSMAGSLFAIINIVLLKLGGSTAVVIARRALKLIEVKR